MCRRAPNESIGNYSCWGRIFRTFGAVKIVLQEEYKGAPMAVIRHQWQCVWQIGRVCLVLFSKSAQNEHLPMAEIVCQSNNPAISETCKAFAAISHSIPSLWSTVILRPRQFNIVGPNFLRARLLRTKGAMLTVCIGLVTERTQEFLALCQLLAEYNTQIREFALTAVSRRCCP